MTYLLVLGAGEDQLATYREARRRGLPTIAVDMRAEAPGARLADRFLHISTRDADAIATAVAGLAVAGVIAPAGDAAQPSVRKLALALGLPPIVSDAAVRCSSNKGEFRQVVADLGLPAYRSEQHRTDAPLVRAAQRIGFPVMVKPSDSSGSKGVTYVAGPDDLDDAIAAARGFSATGDVIVEQFVEGRHLSVEAFLRAGRPEVFVVSERTTTGPPAMVTITHRTPAAIKAREHRAITRAVRKVAAALNLSDGPINVDVILAWDGTPYLIEMGSRLGGNGMPQLVRLATGVDTVSAAVAHACGEPFDVTPRFRRAAMLHILHTGEAGTLERLEGVEHIEQSPEVVACELFVSAGSVVAPYVRAANKLGYVLLAASRPEALDARLRNINEVFRAVVAATPAHKEELV
jgi:biotin carboxylase